MICGAHFPFPGAGSFAKDGSGYAFTPGQGVMQSAGALRPGDVPARFRNIQTKEMTMSSSIT